MNTIFWICFLNSCKTSVVSWMKELCGRSRSLVVMCCWFYLMMVDIVPICYVKMVYFLRIFGYMCMWLVSSLELFWWMFCSYRMVQSFLSSFKRKILLGGSYFYYDFKEATFAGQPLLNSWKTKPCDTRIESESK
jgi:hypothetical protein